MRHEKGFSFVGFGGYCGEITPDELARLYPRLYHATEPGAWPGIERHGLLSASALLDLFEVPKHARIEYEAARRPGNMTIAHPRHGQATLIDNLPLTEAALEKCLDDGMTPAEWLRLLNSRVFFWASEERLMRHLGAKAVAGRERLVIEVDTLSLARAHAKKIELCPINSGSTIRKPARRGPATFTPMGRRGYGEWRRLRGQLDEIVEVTVLGGVPDIARYVVMRSLRRAE